MEQEENGSETLWVVTSSLMEGCYFWLLSSLLGHNLDAFWAHSARARTIGGSNNQTDLLIMIFAQDMNLFTLFISLLVRLAWNQSYKFSHAV